MVSRVLMITTAYEQGVGKGQQAFNRSTGIENPYIDGECNEAWELGYAEGKYQASKMQHSEPIAMLQGFDEYGPRIEWYKHWVDFPIGTQFYAKQT